MRKLDNSEKLVGYLEEVVTMVITIISSNELNIIQLFKA